jgi:hypothetical protein
MTNKNVMISPNNPWDARNAMDSAHFATVASSNASLSVNASSKYCPNPSRYKLIAFRTSV